MPVYNNAFPPSSIAEGEQAIIVNNETLGVGVASARVAIQDKDGSQCRPVLVTITFASPPASTSYDIQVSWDDLPGSYTKVGNSTNVAGDQITFNRAAAGGNAFRFIRAVEQITPGVNATIKVQQ
jgi:hypothetical protein